MTDQIRDVDVWKYFGGTYKCGCCGRIPTFVDIRDLKTCPHCLHQMWWYEKADGSVETLFPDGDGKMINHWEFPTSGRRKEVQHDEISGHDGSEDISEERSESSGIFRGSRVG